MNPDKSHKSMDFMVDKIYIYLRFKLSINLKLRLQQRRLLVSN